MEAPPVCPPWHSAYPPNALALGGPLVRTTQFGTVTTMPNVILGVVLGLGLSMSHGERLLTQYGKSTPSSQSLRFFSPNDSLLGWCQVNDGKVDE